MADAFHSQYPSIEHLRERARQRMPRFAFEYLEGGCFSEINLRRNTDEIREVQLKPWYLNEFPESNLTTELFGKTCDAPFGVAPIGFQGLMWPRATEVLAKAAHQHNIPFVISTVATASIETVAELTEGNAWMTMLKRQLQQVMEQVGCERVQDLPNHLIPRTEL